MDDNNTNPELSAEEVEELQGFKKLYADSTKESQLLAWENKVLKDPKQFISLYDSDKRQAAAIAERNDYDSAEAMLEFIQKETGEWVKGVDDLEKLASKLESIQERKKAAAAVDDYMLDKDIDEESDFWKEFLAEYKSLAWKRSLTLSQAKKYLRIAYNEVKKNGEFADSYNDRLRELKAAGVSGSGKKPEAKKQTYTRNKKVSLADLPKYQN